LSYRLFHLHSPVVDAVAVKKPPKVDKKIVTDKGAGCKQGVLFASVSGDPNGAFISLETAVETAIDTAVVTVIKTAQRQELLKSPEIKVKNFHSAIKS
jgi:hypothetical protein